MPSFRNTPSSGRPQDPASDRAGGFAETFARRPSLPRRGLLPGSRVWATTAVAAALTGAGILTVPLLASIDLTPGSGESSTAVAEAAAEREPGTATPSASPSPSATSSEEHTDRAPAPRGGSGGGGAYIPPNPGVGAGVVPPAGGGAADGADGPKEEPKSGSKSTPSGKDGDAKGTEQGGGSAGGSGAGSAGSGTGGSTGGTGSGGKTPVKQAQGAAQTAPQGVRLVGVASGRCIDVTDSLDGKGRSGTRLQLWDCNPTKQANQAWSFRSDGTIRSMGLCMTVAGNSKSSGAAIQLATCDGGPGQQFYLAGPGDLVNSSADKCVDVLDKGTAAGTKLQLWTCKGTSNQKWYKG
ncbi:ricin-type beta-trefoil lectin domain protein [Streptomyces sp. NPDC088261]|uniref:ricin-type beta-trefoil lectin domain protein n=1 Tax=Streptomyces sp. NPDC088261 TaxID=3365851 RepID=UPI00380C09F6